MTNTLDTPIEEVFQFSNRPSNVLKSNNIRTLKDLLSLTREELRQVHNIGKSYLEIERTLEEYGLCLGAKDEEVASIVEKIKNENKNSIEDKKILEEKLKVLKERYDKEVAAIEKDYILSKYNINKDNKISFLQLINILTERNLTIPQLCRNAGVDVASIRQAIKGQVLLMTGTLAKIAAYLKVPMSQIIEFNGYEMKPEFSKRYGVFENFEIPEVILGEPSYQPFRDFVKSLYQYKSLTEIFNKIEPHSIKKQEVSTKVSKRQHTGISFYVRSKITQNKSINVEVIYKICKLLQCNVDFVFGWK